MARHRVVTFLAGGATAPLVRPAFAACGGGGATAASWGRAAVPLAWSHPDTGAGARTRRFLDKRLLAMPTVVWRSRAAWN